MVISSVPGDNKYIVQGAVVWKSGWDDIDWTGNFVVQMIIFYFKFLIKYYIRKFIIDLFKITYAIS